MIYSPCNKMSQCFMDLVVETSVKHDFSQLQKVFEMYEVFSSSNRVLLLSLMFCCWAHCVVYQVTTTVCSSVCCSGMFV